MKSNLRKPYSRTEFKAKISNSINFWVYELQAFEDKLRDSNPNVKVKLKTTARTPTKSAGERGWLKSQVGIWLVKRMVRILTKWCALLCEQSWMKSNLCNASDLNFQQYLKLRKIYKLFETNISWRGLYQFIERCKVVLSLQIMSCRGACGLWRKRGSPYWIVILAVAKNYFHLFKSICLRWNLFKARSHFKYFKLKLSEKRAYFQICQ